MSFKFFSSLVRSKVGLIGSACLIGSGVSMYCSQPTLDTKSYLKFFTQEQLNAITAKYTQVTVLPISQTQLIYSKIRNQATPTAEFRHHADRIMRMLIEAALNEQEIAEVRRESPCSFYDATELKRDQNDFIAVTIMRAGNSFLHELLQVLPNIDVGQILLQRDETTKEKRPILYYTKLPKRVQNRKILLFDPMIATGGSVIKAIEELLKIGVHENDITFVNLIACEKGLQNVLTIYPQIKIVTGAIDPVLFEDSKYIAPGLGDFGDRYYGTNY